METSFKMKYHHASITTRNQAEIDKKSVGKSSEIVVSDGISHLIEHVGNGRCAGNPLIFPTDFRQTSGDYLSNRFLTDNWNPVNRKKKPLVRHWYYFRLVPTYFRFWKNRRFPMKIKLTDYHGLFSEGFLTEIIQTDFRRNILFFFIFKNNLKIYYNIN